MMIITPYEMARIYWRKLRRGSIFEVQNIILNLSINPASKKYWGEVLIILNLQNHGSGGRH